MPGQLKPEPTQNDKPEQGPPEPLDAFLDALERKDRDDAKAALRAALAALDED